MSTLVFDVAGVPVPQGSTRAFQRGKRIVTTNDPTGRIERWRGDIRQAALRVLPAGFVTLTGPVLVEAHFRLARPQSHYLPANSRRPERVLRPDAPDWHDREPDLDKLLRAVADALTSVLYVDDRQIATFGGSDKQWDSLPGVAISVRRPGVAFVHGPVSARNDAP